ncbi:MAG TPA: hypothetical protein VL357_00635 [Rariglobus sp.]|jgi:hypothetical protein|nr:hypothetical protein [Rariglobus sp.]
MNTTEAKFILQACRPGGQDATDPRFADALAQARQDPALADWFFREQAFDAEVAAKLRAVQPPAELRAAILAGARMSRSSPWWRQTRVMALAASVVLVLGLVAAWPQKAPAIDGSQLALGAMDEMNSPAHHPIVMGGRGDLHALLANASTRLAAGLPLDFAELKADGCRSLSIGGHEVLEVCFERGGNDFHLYVARANDFPAKDSTTEPMFMERGRLASVSWRDRSHAYALVSDSGAENLREIF